MKLTDSDNYLGHRFEYQGNEPFALSGDERELLTQLCVGGFKVSKSYNRRHTSYGFKHVAERILGFYVSNSDMKRAMIDAGFKADPMSLYDINWSFNVAESSPIIKWNMNNVLVDSNGAFVGDDINYL